VRVPTPKNRHNPLTCSDGIRTLILEQGNKVDVTTKRLLKHKRELQMQRASLGRDIDAIDRALTLAGVKLPRDSGAIPTETEYTLHLPFKQMGLKDSCLKVLQDLPDVWFTKTQIEFLLVLGGCEFNTDDAKNSVDVSLRRLADQNLCLVERSRGSEGNRYKHKSREPSRSADEEENSEIEDSGTTNP